MSSESDSDMPKLVWTFPLVRRAQGDAGVLQLGQNIGTLRESIDIGHRFRNNEDEENSQQEESGYSESEQTSELQDELDELKDNSESLFGQTATSAGGDGVTTVEIGQNVFVPVRTKVSPGETVRWVNNDNETHSVMSVEGEEFNSGQLEPGETFEHTFEEEQATVYVDSIWGGEVMCGAVIVGDASLDKQLPCEGNKSEVQFTEDKDQQKDDDSPASSNSSSDSTTRSLSEAVEDKENMDVGFNN